MTGEEIARKLLRDLLTVGTIHCSIHGCDAPAVVVLEDVEGEFPRCLDHQNYCVPSRQTRRRSLPNAEAVARAWAFLTEEESYPPHEFIRASGECICEGCGKKYIDHPYDLRILSGIDGRPFLNILCDGRLVKL